MEEVHFFICQTSFFKNVLKGGKLNETIKSINAFRLLFLLVYITLIKAVEPQCLLIVYQCSNIVLIKILNADKS